MGQRVGVSRNTWGLMEHYFSSFNQWSNLMEVFVFVMRRYDSLSPHLFQITHLLDTVYTFQMYLFEHLEYWFYRIQLGFLCGVSIISRSYCCRSNKDKS